MMYMHPRFETYRDARVLPVEVKPARSPAFLADANEKRFFVRAGPSTTQLKGDEMHQYITQRFN